MRNLAVLALVLLAAAGCGDGGGGPAGAASARHDQVRDAARDAGLPDDVVDLLADAAGAAGETFRVAYDVGGDTPATAELFQAPPNQRVDIRVQQAGEELVRSVITDGRRQWDCSRVQARWACGKPTVEKGGVNPFGDAELDAMVSTLRGAKADYTFRLARREVAGVTARCLVTELKPGRRAQAGIGSRGTLCISPEGVPLLVETPQSSLRAVRYTTTVPGGVFELPSSGNG